MRRSAYPDDEDFLVKPRDRSVASKPRDPNDLLPPKIIPFDHAQSMGWLAHVKNDYWWQTQVMLSVDRFDAVLGWTRRDAFKALAQDGSKGKSHPIRLTRKLGWIIPDIESRKLVFPKEIGARVKIPQFLWLEPPAAVPLISKLGAIGSWSLWATCLSCRFNKFLPIEIDGKAHVACYHCLPPSQYRAIGATPVKKSLIHEALKKYY